MDALTARNGFYKLNKDRQGQERHHRLYIHTLDKTIKLLKILPGNSKGISEYRKNICWT
jgi:hypothetical protein